MNTIKELYRKRKRFVRWVIASSIIPLPGITLGLLIQLLKIDKDIEREINNLDDLKPEVKYFILKDKGDSEKKEQES